MRVLLGKFACSCVEARFGGEVASAVENIVHEYAEDLDADSDGRTGSQLPVPRFWLERGADEGDEFEITLTARTRRILEGEAGTRGVALETSVTHAVFVALAAPKDPGRPDPESRLGAARREQQSGCHGAPLELTASRRRR